MTKTFKFLPTLIAGIFFGPGLILAVPASAQSGDQMRQLLERADTNGDGDVTRAEFDKVRTDMFARLDRNDDGYVDRTDRPRIMGDRFDQAYRMLASLDSNNDQRISQSELAKGEAPAFVAGDSNGDQVLSRTEIAALRPSR